MESRMDTVESKQRNRGRRRDGINDQLERDRTELRTVQQEEAAPPKFQMGRSSFDWQIDAAILV
eukprot:9256976-Pyramimonas_sp.AAC.1